MILLIAGLVLFVLIHLVPIIPGLKVRIVESISSGRYMLVFSLISIISLALIVFGLKAAPFVPLYDPPTWGRTLALVMMLPAIYLFASNGVGNAPSSAQAFTAHPMNLGVIVWATAHLFANGDLAHVLLFATFAGFSVISIVSANTRGAKPKRDKRPPLIMELVFITIIACVYALLMWAHPLFTGMPLIAG